MTASLQLQRCGAVGLFVLVQVSLVGCFDHRRAVAFRTLVTDQGAFHQEAYSAALEARFSPGTRFYLRAGQDTPEIATGLTPFQERAEGALIAALRESGSELERRVLRCDEERFIEAAFQNAAWTTWIYEDGAEGALPRSHVANHGARTVERECGDSCLFTSRSPCFSD